MGAPEMRAESLAGILANARRGIGVGAEEAEQLVILILAQRTAIKWAREKLSAIDALEEDLRKTEQHMEEETQG
jgi:hypothetical protein